MTYEVYQRLLKLRQKHGPQEFGRICQALLELALREVGFKTRGRSVERPDIVGERGPDSYAIEVKAPSDSEVTLTQHDLDGLKDFESKGVTSVVAVLAFTLTPHWVLSKGRNLKAGKHNITALRHYSISALEQEIEEAFPVVLNQHFDVAMTRGSKGLREKLGASG